MDAYEFSAIKQDNISRKMLTGEVLPTTVGGAVTAEIADANNRANEETVEYRPMFHEWATVQPGMICVARKKKTAVFRQYIAAETAVPVIACAACLPKVSRHLSGHLQLHAHYHVPETNLCAPY